jgi:hypothetical protein
MQKGIEYQKLVEEKCLEFETEYFSNLTNAEKLILMQSFGKIKDNSFKRKLPDKIIQGL